MALRSFTEFIPVRNNLGNSNAVRVVKWTGLLNGDTGAPYVCPEGCFKTVHVYGTPGATPHILIQGSNEQTYDPSSGALSAPDYQTLHNDQTGAALDFTAVGINKISESPTSIR